MTKASPGRLLAGCMLCLLFLAGLVGFGTLSLGHVLLDLAGESVGGRVIDVRESQTSSRYVRRALFSTLEYSFETRAGEAMVASDSVIGSAPNGMGPQSPVTVTYLPGYPWFSRLVRPDNMDPLFLGSGALALVCAWLAAMSLYRALVPPPRAEA